MKNITHADILAEIHYDPATGVIIRKGRVSETRSAKGYFVVRVGKKQHPATRVVWFWQTGALPAGNIVFIDGDRSNLRWANLRIADNMDAIDAGRVREVFDYDASTGNLIYRRNRGGQRGAGDVAGRICRRPKHMGGGYRIIGFNGREYGAHQLVWIWWYGKEAEGCVDHINMQRDDNRIENLRQCSHSENMSNRRAQSNNTSGFKGVSRIPRSTKWRATLCNTHIGSFETAEEAHAAYTLAIKERFGEFARTV